MTEKFRKAVESFNRATRGSVCYELHKLFKDLKKSEKTASTMGVIKALNIENVHEQRDAAEYLEKILESVNPELSEMFVGETTILTICQGNCKKSRKQILPFYSLPITLTPDPNDVVNVQSCFNAHFSEELMSGENQLYCQHCEIDTDRKMICELSKFPEVLILQLKRFQLDDTLWTFVKNNCSVSVPYQLRAEVYTYDLYAVINHTGSLSGGHYYVSIKSFDDGHWYEFNDSRVYPTTNTARSMHTTNEGPRVPPKAETDFITDKACTLLYKRGHIEQIPLSPQHESTSSLTVHHRASVPREDVVVTKEKARDSSGKASTQSMNWQDFPCCSSEDLGRDSHGHEGLRNQGATCYLNTALQTLFMTEKFREAVESFNRATRGSVCYELQKLFKDLKKGEKTALTMGVIKALNIETGHEQRDAAEYLEKILESVDPKLSEMFVGETTTLTICQGNCKKAWKQILSFCSLPITLTPDHQNVQSCFNSLFGVKVMNGGNQQYCQHCQRETEMRCELSKFPEVLVLQLKRFQVDNSTTRTIINCSVPYQLRTEVYTYDLYAVINHTGSLSGGHYYVSIRSLVTHVPQKPEMDFITDKACILFYKQQLAEDRTLSVLPKEENHTIKVSLGGSSCMI